MLWFVFCIPRHSLRCYCADCDRRLCPVHTEWTTSIAKTCRVQNTECWIPTRQYTAMHCNLEQHLVCHDRPGVAPRKCCCRTPISVLWTTSSIERTYRIPNIQNTKYRSATFVLVPSNKSLQLCHRRSSTQHISAAFAIMQSSVVVGKDHFSFVEAKWWLVVTRNQSYRVEPRGWGIYSFGIAVPILYVCI